MNLHCTYMFEAFGNTWELLSWGPDIGTVTWARAVRVDGSKSVDFEYVAGRLVLDDYSQQICGPQESQALVEALRGFAPAMTPDGFSRTPMAKHIDYWAVQRTNGRHWRLISANGLTTSNIRVNGEEVTERPLLAAWDLVTTKKSKYRLGRPWAAAQRIEDERIANET